MPNALSKDLRNLLARVTLDARETAERAAKAALENLAVHEKDYRPHMKIEQRQLRNRLRARGRALGDEFDAAKGTQGITRLVEDAAYEHWHRILFTKFLAENDLLHTGAEDGHVQVTLQDCDELAQERGARDGFELACRFASEILPGVFRPDDPIFDLALATNDQIAMRRLAETLPKEVFTSDDGLGWTYQFWQAKRKDEVNDSGRKIDASDLPAVTQLFTEDYMVDFLLHNTLGAWWAGKREPITATTEAEARSKVALAPRNGLRIDWTYLRLTQDAATGAWTPAAGVYSDWPRYAREISCLDPCMGSGHFLVRVLEVLTRLRMEEEGVSPAQAVQLTLSENIFGLELDPRCAQLGAFSLALKGWQLGGYQPLSKLNIACSGLAPQATEKQWNALAGADERLRRGMSRLYDLFSEAPVLGSLINPRHTYGDLTAAGFHDLEPLLAKTLAREGEDGAAGELIVAAQGVARAAEIMSGEFVLVATNVPYLGRGRQNESLKEYLSATYPDGKADLATCFVARCLEFAKPHGTLAVVTPQNWLFLGGYQAFRRQLLNGSEWLVVARLGEGGFQSPQAAGAFVGLFVFTNAVPARTHRCAAWDASDDPEPTDKANRLGGGPLTWLEQRRQLDNPDATVVIGRALGGAPLRQYAGCWQGIVTGDDNRFILKFWELAEKGPDWEWLQGPPQTTEYYCGRESVIRWEQQGGDLHLHSRAHNFPSSHMLRRPGIAFQRMRNLNVTLFSGEIFGDHVAPVVPTDSTLVPALWCFCNSDDYRRKVREFDSTLKVSVGAFLKVAFDEKHWRKVADGRFSAGLPKASSSDPTQWLFAGGLSECTQVLHVALARLLGYRWPRQLGVSFPSSPALPPDGLDEFRDGDGIVCLASLNREKGAAHRLRAMLATALGQFDEVALIAAAGGTADNLDEWLRDECFAEHCELFQGRPFIWHIWDGRRDGFHALLNYHRLDHETLQKLTYSYLGDWIRTQEEQLRSEKAGADLRLGAARDLQASLALILRGEAPFDIFARWKPITQQPIGWHPDPCDGVRTNIRPFVEAGVLRRRVKIKWEKDRGSEPERSREEFPWFWCEKEPGTDPKPGRSFSGNRWNNVHLTLDYKRAARR